MNKYTLKDGTIIESVDIGRAKIKLGDISPDGMMTICDRAPNLPGQRKARVICKCRCGNYTVIDAQSFYNGTTKSCGCYNKEVRKEVGQRIGKLSKQSKDYSQVNNPYYDFIKRLDEKDSSNSYYWEIKCKRCGQSYKAIPALLISNERRRGNNPCKCWHFSSKGIMKIRQILGNANITFIEEYSFEDCLSPKGIKLRFDFFLPQFNCLIEYDGEQHFYPTSFGSKSISGEDRLKLSQTYDKIKDNYCINNNLTLIRIPYTKYKELKLEDLLQNKEE